MFDNIEKELDVDLKKFSTFKIGGVGKIMLFPKNIYELKRILSECQKNNLEYFILGNGSNILFPDDFFDKIIINLKNFCEIKVLSPKILRVGAGVKLFALHKFCADNNLSNLEWSYGIPATIGGLVYMNGGAFGYCIFDFVKRVKILENGKVVWKSQKDINYSYRKSNLDGIVLAVELKLTYCKGVKERQKDYFERRKESQPYDMPSVGSVFKRENNIIPAKIIDNCGLKGVKIGKAEVSKKHAGFIINIGDATAHDVVNLIKIIRTKTGVNFETEIIILE